MVQGYPKKIIPVQVLDAPSSYEASGTVPTPIVEADSIEISGYSHEQWRTYKSEKSKLHGFEEPGREVGGFMLNITGLNRFYFVRDFHDMRCKYDKVLSI